MGIRSYVERVREAVHDNIPEQATRLQKVCVVMAELIIGLPESGAWRSFPVVDSPEIAWNGPDADRQVIKQELQEIEHEPAANS